MMPCPAGTTTESVNGHIDCYYLQNNCYMALAKMVDKYYTCKNTTTGEITPWLDPPQQIGCC